MSNAETAVLLSTIQKSKGIQRPPEAFTKSLSYAQAHMGAVQLTDVEEIDELFTALRSLEFERPVLDADDGGEGGGVEKIRLHQYQVRDIISTASDELRLHAFAQWFIAFIVPALCLPCT